jgi:hypothetical protein
MTEIVTVLGKTGSKQVVVETGKTIKHMRPRVRVEQSFRERLTPAPDVNDAQPAVVPPYSTPKDHNLFNVPAIREYATPVVDMTADATEF